MSLESPLVLYAYLASELGFIIAAPTWARP